MYDGCPDGAWRLSAHNADMNYVEIQDEIDRFPHSNGVADIYDYEGVNQIELHPKHMAHLSAALAIARLRAIDKPENWVIGY